MGGFAFDPQAPASPLWRGFPAGRLVAPAPDGGDARRRVHLTLNAVLDPGADIAAEERRLAYCDAIFGARGRLRRRHLDWPRNRSCWRAARARGARGVGGAGRRGSPRLRRGLCRESGAGPARCDVAAAQPFDPAVVLARLRDAYPSAYIFAVAHGGRCFLGATPERLVRLRDGAWTWPAWPARRRAAARPRRTPTWAARCSPAPRTTPSTTSWCARCKDRLAPVACDLRIPVAPRLLQLHNVQHLYTPVEAQVRPGVGVLDLVQWLHPTPAVGGYPREAALAYIRAHEGLDRGWYAGPIGWVDRRGEGEFAVALRSALLDGAAATLFAGCGIVAASRPADEYAETCLKLRPMLTALRGDEDMA